MPAVLRLGWVLCVALVLRIGGLYCILVVMLVFVAVKVGEVGGYCMG